MAERGKTSGTVRVGGPVRPSGYSTVRTRQYATTVEKTGRGMCGKKAIPQSTPEVDKPAQPVASDAKKYGRVWMLTLDLLRTDASVLFISDI